MNYPRFAVWGSLSRDYMAVMASSVSSERAFSAAGITISKRRNRLKGDVVEALQFLKCMLRNDLIYWEAPSSATEVESDDEDQEGDPEQGPSWDLRILADDSDVDN